MNESTLPLFEALRDTDRLVDWLSARCETAAGDCRMHGYEEVRNQAVLVHDEGIATRYVLQLFADSTLKGLDETPIKFVIEHAVTAQYQAGGLTTLSYGWRLLEPVSLKNWIFTTCLSAPVLPRESANWLSTRVIADGLTLTPEIAPKAFATEAELQAWLLPALDRAITHWDESMEPTRRKMSDLVRMWIGSCGQDRLSAGQICEIFESTYLPGCYSPLRATFECLNARTKKLGFVLDPDIMFLPQPSTVSNKGDGYVYFAIQTQLFEEQAEPSRGDDAVRLVVAGWRGRWNNAAQQLEMAIRLEVRDERLATGLTHTFTLEPLNLSQVNLGWGERIREWLTSADVTSYMAGMPVDDLVSEMLAELIP